MSIYLIVFSILVSFKIINYNSVLAQLITQQPSSCSSTSTYYDGPTYSCQSVDKNKLLSDNPTVLSCAAGSQYRKLGQICVKETQASTDDNSIYEFNGTNYVFTKCLSSSFQINNQLCFPQLNTCTLPNCIYLDSMKQSIPNIEVNGLALGTIYNLKTTETESFSYKASNIIQSAVSITANKEIEKTVKNVYSCLGAADATKGRQHPKSCNYLVNKCLIRGFLSTVDDCKILQYLTYQDGKTLQYHLTEDFTSSAVDQIFYINVFEEDGEWVDFRQLTTEFQLCDKGTKDDSAFKTFGTSFDNRCKLDPTSIKSSSQFFELYTKDSSSKNSNNKYSKVPAKITHSDLLDDSSTITVTRFYLYENNFYDNTLQVAQRINIVIDVESKEATLEITYRKLTTTSGSITVNFSVSYQSSSNSIDNFWLIIKIIFSIFIVLVFLWSLIRIYIYTMYNPHYDGQRRYMPGYTKQLVINIFTILCDCYGEALMFFLFILSAAIYIIAKKITVLLYKKASQTPTFVVPPYFSSSDIYDSFIICCAFGFSFKLIATFHLIYKQSNCQIYFLDWEPKKNYAHEEEDTGPSSWRTLFVANEFNELAVYRIVSVEWTLFFMAMLMSGIEWQNGASNTFSSSSTLQSENVKINIIYKFFIDIGLFFFIALVQIFGRYLVKIWFPFKIQDFSDFCSVSNISIFIFDEYLHGYYLHGQSPDKYAEGNSLWLMACLGDDVPFSLFGNNGNYGNQYPRYPNQNLNNSMFRSQGMQGYPNYPGQFGGQQQSNRSFGNQNPMAVMGGIQGPEVKPQKAKRAERGLNGTDQQIFEFFLSWDLREQIDFMFDIREKSILYHQRMKKAQELAKKKEQEKRNQQESKKEMDSIKGDEEEEKEIKKQNPEQEENKQENDPNYNYFSDLNEKTGEELFKPKMDGIFREVIKSMNQGAGQNSNVFEMEFLQRFLMHLPPPSHVDRRFNQNMFYIDRDNIFSSVLYSGYEFTLLYFLITVYAFIDLVSESTLIAVIVTYALDYIFKYIRQERGQQNLESKAGIEDMFLI